MFEVSDIKLSDNDNLREQFIATLWLLVVALLRRFAQQSVVLSPSVRRFAVLTRNSALSHPRRPPLCSPFARIASRPASPSSLRLLCPPLCLCCSALSAVPHHGLLFPPQEESR